MDEWAEWAKIMLLASAAFLLCALAAFLIAFLIDFMVDVAVSYWTL